jgi:dissimilatory sulfite reductase (desulfoviridin) alpha/beta subunit
LVNFTHNTDIILDTIKDIISQGSVTAQQNIYKEIIELARKEGYRKYFDVWGEKLDIIAEI